MRISDLATLEIKTNLRNTAEVAEKQIGVCVVCKGDVVEDRVNEFDASSGPLVFGPASRYQYRKTSKGWYCEDCGLKYQFRPSNNPNKTRSH